MRNNNKKSTRKSTTLNFLRIAILAICFVLTFSFALTSEVLSFGGENSLPNGGNTASAAEVGAFGYGAKGAHTPVLPTTFDGKAFPGTDFPSAVGVGENAGRNSVGWVSATDFGGFPFADAFDAQGAKVKTSKTFKLDYSGAEYSRDATKKVPGEKPGTEIDVFAPEKNNISTSWQKDPTKDPPSNSPDRIIPDANIKFEFFDDKGNNGFHFITFGRARANAVINLELPEFIVQLMNSPCFTVDYNLKFKAKIDGNTGSKPWCYIKSKVMTTPDPIESKDASYTLCTSDSDGANEGYDIASKTEIKDIKEYTYNSTDATMIGGPKETDKVRRSPKLTAINSNIAIALDWGRDPTDGIANYFGEQQFNVKDITAEYTLTYNPVDKDGNPIVESKVNDGVAPAFSSIDKAATTPVRDYTNGTPGTPSTQWPVYFDNDAFRGCLNPDFVEDADGNVQLRSFVNRTSIFTIPPSEISP
ncbi:MAG: hypothetical protein RR338_03730, partial [Clostridia bacterium]